MKKNFFILFIVVVIVLLLSGCSEQKNNKDNGENDVEINYYDMERFAGLWFNQSGIVPEYYFVTKDGKIFTLDKEQFELLKNDYENFSKIVLSWESYKKYRFVAGYYELYNFTNKKFFRYATYYFIDDNFVFNEIETGQENIYTKVLIE